jgi:hypothetical protein
MFGNVTQKPLLVKKRDAEETECGTGIGEPGEKLSPESIMSGIRPQS